VLTSNIVGIAAPGRWETRPSGNEAAFGLSGNRLVGKRNGPRQQSSGSSTHRQRRAGQAGGNVRQDNDPSTSPSSKLVIANYYAIRSWPEQRELRGLLAESTFGSVIPSSRLQARLRSRCKRTPKG
jgi:hypothetical protein